MNFLAEIIERKQQRVAEAKAETSLDAVRARAFDVTLNRAAHAFRKALEDRCRVNVIAEFKRRSPSKGVIRANANPAEVAHLYQTGGAAAISVLTEEDYFDGSLDDLRLIKRTVELPVLRKDFVLDEYQVYEAAANGADAVLLIVAALDDDSLRTLRETAEADLGLDALVEVHTAAEMKRAIASGASLIGVNNRNLSTFEVTLQTSLDLGAMATTDTILVSESGLDHPRDLKQLRDVGYQAFLIGETLMRSAEPDRTLQEFLEV